MAERTFVSKLASLGGVSKSFGRTYVNITLRPDDDGPDAQLREADRAFAAEIDALLG